MIYALNSTSVSIDVFIGDDTGLPVTGLVAATFPALTWNLAGPNADTSITLADLATITTAWAATTTWGLKERGNGYYRLDLANGLFTTAGVVTIRGEATGKHLIMPDGPIQVQVPVDVTTIKTQSVTCAQAVTVNANVGTTQPVNFDGTGATAFVKSDVEHWLTAAPAALTANGYLQAMLLRWLTDNAAGTPNALVSGDVQAAPDWAHVINPTTAVGLTGTTISTTQQVASVSGAVGSVTGAVGSVTGNVGGNVVGSVASVTGAVGSVTGNVGGNVTGSVGSVVAAVALSSPDTAIVQSGTAQAGAATTITLAAGASATNNLYDGCTVSIYGGTGAGQTRTITAYNGTTKIATVDYAWTTNPDATSTYAVKQADNAALNASLQTTAASVQGNVTGSVASVTGAVTVGANNDKTGYSLTQAFPTNFSALAITLGGAVTVGTNNDKTGYTASTVQDKTGYSLSVTPPTSAAISTQIWQDLTAGGDFLVTGSIGNLIATKLDPTFNTTGLRLVNQDYGGTDALSYKTSGGVGIADAMAQIYLTSDYVAGRTANSYIQAHTTTDVNGHWNDTLLLNPGAYSVIFYLAGKYGPDRKDFTVT